ncbi:MAG: hypothetical protein ACLQEQ_00945 [Nitrososphaerales archaeon]
MGRLNLTVTDEFERRFRQEVSSRLGFKHGNIQKAVEEALEDWMKKKPSKATAESGPSRHQA